MEAKDTVSYYELLGVSKQASSEQIKRAYHQALLRHHPDKQTGRSVQKDEESRQYSTLFPDVDALRKAYETLSNPTLRLAYDQSLKTKSHRTEPRPANVVSLDEFDESETSEGTLWSYPCRCGGAFVVSEALLEKDVHLVGCDCCSEFLWVGYEVEDDGS
ncbi:hypothetical protein PIIN_10492 [Serendipita indica DSM 11827]|uniref:Diphthamide biosynthesis protein 4 n=1 Tax=Serendipita indica (strain DSM 11827) TaxID=1109443 RepID=G4TYV6_SERID|nr:hypothetical protein PIIN_10492 [Serendipita indica DSM 11827]